MSFRVQFVKRNKHAQKARAISVDVDLYLVLQNHRGFQETSITCRRCSRIFTHRLQTTFENIVTNGEIAQYEQILLFATMFSTIKSYQTFNDRYFQT